LLAETGDLPVLRFALLFHDTGKAGATGRHVERSLQLAEAAMERTQMPAAERRSVRLLIDAHLDLSAAMTSRDLDDPAVVRSLADRAGTLEDLQRLTLLTYADISAVNPGAMTPWRLDQLWRVYLALHHELTRELASDRIVSPPRDAGEFAEGFPVRYLRTHTPEQMRLHEELERRSRDRGVAIDLTHEGGYWRLTLAAKDRPALLASVAGALAAFGMNILKAEGFANLRGTVLDVFVFADPHHTLELNPSEVDRLRLMLERVTLGRTDVRALLEGRAMPARSKRLRIRPTVTFDQSASDSATLVEIVAEDRPGLLYTLASAISERGANIELVLIDTEGHKALDVFYVTRNGRKLTPEDEAGLRNAFVKGGL
jgi:[protein-PII] uridylyltransferase